MYQADISSFKQWHEYKQENSLLQRKGIPECALFVVQRPSKYPLLIEALIGSSRDSHETERLKEAKKLVTGILEEVNAQVAEKEKDVRRMELFNAIDAKSCAPYENGTFKKSDIFDRKLKWVWLKFYIQ